MFNLSLTACSFSIKKLHSRRPDKVFELNHEISGVYNEREFSANSVKELFEAFFLSHEELEKDVVKKQTFREPLI